MYSDWVKEVTLLGTTNQSALFQHCTVTLCLLLKLVHEVDS